MLILSRKPEESIVIQGDIIVTVLAVEGDKVKLGIKAPRDVQVYRQELWLAIQEQNQIVEKLAQEPSAAGFESLRAYLAEQVAGSGEEPLEPVGPTADAVDVG
jgi:carbon storage regulator